MGEWSFFFYQMFVSGAAFSVYKTAPVTLLQLQLPLPLFFLLVLFGFDWIFHSPVELPRTARVASAYILALLGVETPADLIIDMFAGRQMCICASDLCCFFLCHVKSSCLHARILVLSPQPDWKDRSFLISEI